MRLQRMGIRAPRCVARPRAIGRGLIAIGVATSVVAVLLAWPARQARAAASWPCDVRTTDRVVAVGDVHGAYDRFLAILQTAGLVDGRERWTGGRAILVQTGDVLDRGPDSRKALDLLRQLERDAPRQGGQVIALLGNHEVMRLVGDWRYVSAGEFEAFKTSGSADLRERVFEKRAGTKAARDGASFDARLFRQQFDRDTPLGAIELGHAFDTKGEYGAWIRRRPTVAHVNGVLFLHGGLTESLASLGCAGINDTIQRDLAALAVTPEKLSELTALSELGPLWHRRLALDDDTTVSSTLDVVLERLRSRAIVVGHTVTKPGRIVARLGGRVIQIDTGMVGGSFFPNGAAAALEIQGSAVTAVYLDRREPLPTPALDSVSAPSPPAPPAR